MLFISLCVYFTKDTLKHDTFVIMVYGIYSANIII